MGDSHPDLIVLGEPSLAVRDGVILAVGDRSSMLDLGAPGTEVLDYGTAAVRPGLRDAHAHLVMTGLARRRLDLRGMDLKAIRSSVVERVRATSAGGWVRGAGFSFASLGTEVPPGATDLDDIAPDHPVALASHDLHALWVNTRALEAAGRPAGSPSYLTEDEVRKFNDAAGRADPDECLAAARNVIAEFHRHGITSVQEHGTLAHLQALLALALSGELLLDVSFSIRDHELPRYVEVMDEIPSLPGQLEVNGMKLFLDGAFGSRTAWLLEPYAGSDRRGHRAIEAETARKRVAFAANLGLPTFMHAIGDAAVREALDLAESAPGLRHRVEHAQMIDPADLARFAALGVGASVQPVHLVADAMFLPGILGEERASRCFVVRSLLESGAEVTFGSDTPVETPDPMKGVYAATTRRNPEGVGLPGDESIPVGKAFELYFSRPALTPGDPANLSVWETDPADLPPAEILDLRPLATIYRGTPVHGAPAVRP